MNLRFWKRNKTIRAREFVLEDNEGRERASLRTDATGNSLLLFRGPNGGTRCYMGATQDGTPRLALFYANGKGTIQLEANDHLNTAALVVAGPCGKSKIVLTITADGLPFVVVYDEHGAAVLNEPVGLARREEATGDRGSTDWDGFLRS